jgi:cation diffusion facilitator CzcD-associated flavoprotein CzcO
MKKSNLPIAIIGAGPVGLAVAAHLSKNNQNFIIFEGEKSVGANILTWGHVKVFSPWEYNIDKLSEELLVKNGITIPNKKEVPFGKQLVSDYLKPLSEIPVINQNLHLNTKVLSVGRKGLDKMKNANREKLPFSIQVNENGSFKIYEAKAVIDASGTWQNPNPVGSGGVFAIGEKENGNHFFLWNA